MSAIRPARSDEPYLGKAGAGYRLARSDEPCLGKAGVGYRPARRRRALPGDRLKSAFGSRGATSPTWSERTKTNQHARLSRT